MSRILVIPSNREACLHKFLAAWQGVGGWDEVILIEDTPTCTFDVKVDRRYAHEDIARIVGDDAWIFSKGDSARRCFGLLAAYHAGADYVLTLDDDCFPIDGQPPLMTAHIAAMSGFLRWQTSCNGLRVRGIPYKNLGKLPPTAAHVGLWQGVPDLDGKMQLQWEAEGRGYFHPPPGAAIIPHGQYLPVCGMNLCIRRDAIPLFYFPLMGEGQPYRRFDDIWAGVIAKKICDHLGWHISVGEPFVEHRRASDARANAEKEAPGVDANESFWEAVDGIELPEWHATVTDLVAALGGELKLAGHGEYLTRLGASLRTWARLFDNRPAGL